MVDGLRRPSTHLLILRRANRLRARRNCAFSRACNFATWMVADVSLCLSLSRTDSMAAEERSRRLKATGTKGRRHCESTYNEVTHAFTTRIFLPFKRSSGSGDGAFFSLLLRIIRWSLIETSLKREDKWFFRIVVFIHKLKNWRSSCYRNKFFGWSNISCLLERYFFMNARKEKKGARVLNRVLLYLEGVFIHLEQVLRNRCRLITKVLNSWNRKR